MKALEKKELLVVAGGECDCVCTYCTPMPFGDCMTGKQYPGKLDDFSSCNSTCFERYGSQQVSDLSASCIDYGFGNVGGALVFIGVFAIGVGCCIALGRQNQLDPARAAAIRQTMGVRV